MRKTSLRILFLAAFMISVLGVASDVDAGCHPCSYILFNGWQCDNSRSSQDNCIEKPYGCQSQEDEECKNNSGGIQPEQQFSLQFDQGDQVWLLAAVDTGATNPDFADAGTSKCRQNLSYVIY